MQITNFISKANSKVFAPVSMFFPIVFGVSCLGLSLLQMSYYLGMIGTYNLIFGLAKFSSYQKYREIQTFDNSQGIKEAEHLAAKRIAIFSVAMTVAILCFAVVDTFFYHDVVAQNHSIFIYYFGGYALINITVCFVNTVRTRKNKSLIIHHLKLLSFANALIALSITQRTILHYAKHPYAAVVSGIGEIFFGLCALFVCLLMFKKGQKDLLPFPKPCANIGA